MSDKFQIRRPATILAESLLAGIEKMAEYADTTGGIPKERVADAFVGSFSAAIAVLSEAGFIHRDRNEEISERPVPEQPDEKEKK